MCSCNKSEQELPQELALESLHQEPDPVRQPPPPSPISQETGKLIQALNAEDVHSIIGAVQKMTKAPDSVCTEAQVQSYKQMLQNFVCNVEQQYRVLTHRGQTCPEADRDKLRTALSMAQYFQGQPLTERCQQIAKNIVRLVERTLALKAA